MTTTTENNIASLTIKETYDKPRKCGNCGKTRKVNLVESTHANGTVLTSQMCAGCYDARKVWVGAPTHQPQGNDAATPTAAPNPVIMDGIAGILSGTTSVEQVLADADAILAPERYGLDGEADAILSPAPKPAIGPEPGEELPKTFTDAIRKRVAGQHLAGATVPDLAKAWGRTPSSIKVIIAKFPNG